MERQDHTYSQLARIYRQSGVNPDRKYSIVPTVVQIAGDVVGKHILNLGAGNGDFARAFIAADADRVTAIDRSDIQITLAKREGALGIKYMLGDALSMRLPDADIIAAPWMLDFIPRVSGLFPFFERCYRSLVVGGRLVTVANLPDESVEHTYGIRKELLGPKEDGTPIKVDFFRDGKFLCSIDSVYFTPETIVHTLKEVGFVNVQWHDPIVHPDGITDLGQAYWDTYLQGTELGYVTADKPHPKER